MQRKPTTAPDGIWGPMGAPNARPTEEARPARAADHAGEGSARRDRARA